MSNEIDTNDNQTRKESHPVSSESNESDYIEEQTVSFRLKIDLLRI
jgi:hypothetical protein